MPHPKVFFVVGHSNWGKSETLRALTNGSHRVRRTTIADLEVFIRRMSNDDLPESFIKRMSTIHPDHWPYIIAALCPDFDDPEKKTATVLQALKDNGYKLFFWVLQKQYGTDEIITAGELSQLRSYGKVELVTEAAEAGARAKKLRSYVASAIGA